LWKGRLWRIMVPAEIPDEYRWVYVQNFVVNGSHGESMHAVLRLQYPGIGWSGFSGFKESVIPFGLCGLEIGDASVSLSDMSSPAFASHNRSQMRRPPSSGRGAMGAVSGTGAPHRPAPPHATSSGGRPRVPSSGAVQLTVNSKKSATPRTVGWMGSTSTSA